MKRPVHRLVSMALPTLALLATLGWGARARAEGEACLRDSECAGSELCFEGACTQTKQKAATCAKEDTAQCEAWDVCVDDLCKRDDLVCRTALGVCFFGETRGACQCANAPGIEWEGDPPDVGSPSEDPTGQCFDLLAATCPDDVPEPVCDTETQRTACEAFVAQENALNEVCSGYVNDDPVRIAGAVEFCCGAFDESGVAAYRACVLGLSPEDCAGFEACADGESSEGTSTGGIPTEDPTADPTDDAPLSGESEPEEEAIGCQVGGAGSAWFGALLVFGLLGVRRRDAQ